MPIRRLNDFADTCVFSKQSSGPIHCDPFRLPTQRGSPTGGSPSPEVTGTVCRVPWPRLTRAPEATRLAHLCRFAVRSVTTASSAKLFSTGCFESLDGARRPLRHRRSASPPGFAWAAPRPTTLHRAPQPDGSYAPASLLGLQRPRPGTGILTRFPSATPLGLALGTD